MAEFDPTLSQVQRINAAFDEANDSAGSRYADPELHIGLHIVKAAEKLLAVKERSDHPGVAIDDTIIDTEVIPDLLKYALQLAELRGHQITELYVGRLASLEVRNGTLGSAAQALKAINEV